MSWFRLQLDFYEHPKFVGLSNDAMAVWVQCVAYSNRFLTDGFIPKVVALRFAHGEEMVVAELVTRELWMVSHDGYQFHDWFDWNASKAEVQTRRRREAERQRETYRRRKTSQGDSHDGGGKTSRNRNKVIRPVNGGRAEYAEVDESHLYGRTHEQQSKTPKGVSESAGARDGAPPALEHEPVDREHQRKMAAATLGPLRAELAEKRRRKLAAENE